MSKFTRKMSIDIQHSYFSSSVGNFLSLSPTKECAILMTRYGLMAKIGDRFEIYSQEENGHAKAEPDPKQPFNFLIQITDPQFFRYTKLPSKKADEVYIFSNQKNKQELKITIGDQIKPGLFGIMRLYFNFPLTNTDPFILKFEASGLKWKYYLLTSDTLASPVIDGSVAGIAFSKQSAKGTEADAVAKSLTSSYPKANVSVFGSDTEVASSQMGRKNIRLKNALNDTVVIAHLPNPGPDDNGLKIINLLN